MKQSSLSKRGTNLSEITYAASQADHFAALDDLYNPEKNPGGYINMGASETALVNDEVIALITKVLARSRFRSEDIHYYVNYGSPEFRGAIAGHWQTVVFKNRTDRRITADNIVLSTGATVVLDMLAHMICDPGDVFLVPVPCYAMFEFDVGGRAGAVIEGVDDGGRLDVSAFENALASQKQQGKNVRGVLMSSPHNPNGTVYTEAQLKGMIDFCMKNDLELISDEIYCETIFDDSVNWTSMLDLVPDEYLTRVHSVQGFAKDFSLPGFKVGFVISFNEAMLAGLRNLAYFSPVSNAAQFILTGILRAPELDEFFSVYKKRLRESYEQVAQGLRELDLPMRPAQGGAFVMADFARYLPERTVEHELRLYDTLHRDLKINLAPGVAYREPTPGWLRICYAQGPAATEELFRRLKTLGPA